MSKFTFDRHKIKVYETDFSIYNASLIQYKILDEVSWTLSRLIELPQGTIRTIIIRFIVDEQKRISRFWYEVEEEIPQRKIAWAFELFTDLCDLFASMLTDQSLKNELCSIIDHIFEDYTDEYAHRETKS